MPQRFLSIKNFEKYQHYKHRNPPWIKLHLEILDDPDFLELPDQAKWHYIGLLLLASRHENAIPPNTNYLSNRLHLTSPVNLSLRFLKDHVLAPRKQSASKLHTNADSETEKSRDRVETETECLRRDEFAEFWSVYPKKIGKEAARKAWAKLNGTRPALVDIIQAIENAKRTDQWTKDNGQFIPNPSTWLNQHRWEDEAMRPVPSTFSAFLARGGPDGTH